jgi:soluble lytic murein transglycosylase-like protein
MRVGWNRRYVLHRLFCDELILRSFKLLVFAAILSSFIFAFPIATGIVLSDRSSDSLAADLPVSPAALLPVIDPAVRTIEQFLSNYGVPIRQRNRIAAAVVHSARSYNVDPKLIAAVIIVESSANPFAISERQSVGLMQIHLPTWGPTVDRENLNLFRVEDNVELGVRILKDYISEHGLWAGIMRYRGWTDASPDSQQGADDYVHKVRNIYQPDTSFKAESSAN